MANQRDNLSSRDSDTNSDASIDDIEVFENRVTRWQRPLFAYLGRMGLTPAVTEEIAQEALLRCWREKARYRPERSAWSTWLFTIARNLAINELKRQRRQPQPFSEKQADGQIDADHFAGQQTATDSLQQREHSRAISTAMQRVSQEDREILALALIDEIPAREAAQVLGCNDAAYRTRLSRARKRIRTHLERLLGDAS